jgi:sterol desaturase/sphingolipid hydroxylase (fatty acid hydroxylase superfamily)
MGFSTYDTETLLFYGLGTYLVLLASWSCTCLPFFAIDRFRLLDKHRIQKGSEGGPAPAAISPAVHAAARKMVLINWSWLLPATLAGAPVLRQLFPVNAPAPPLWQAPFLAYLWFILHDVSFYCYHRTLHEVPGLYRRFHKPHHILTAPFAWGSHAVHPVEMLLQSIGALAGPLIWSFAFGLPIKVVWAWVALIQVQGVWDHSGYDLPLDVFKVVPGFGGTTFHDDHHKHFTCNYAAAFSAIDYFMGTTREQRFGARERSGVKKDLLESKTRTSPPRPSLTTSQAGLCQPKSSGDATLHDTPKRRSSTPR